MQTEQNKAFNNTLDPFIDQLLPELEEIYKDIHRNPELCSINHSGISPLVELKCAAYADVYISPP